MSGRDSSGPEDQLTSEPLVLRLQGQDCACSYVYTGTPAFPFPHLTLSLSLFTKNDCSYFGEESQESQAWGGNREEVLILLLHAHPLPGPGDPTLKNVSVQVEHPEYSLLEATAWLTCSFCFGASSVEFS